MPLKPGDIVERYVVLGLLGEGGMGQVFRARDTRLQRLVALKILHSAPADAPPVSTGGGGRILREARAAAALDHPNVVAIHDVGEVEGPTPGERIAYLAMELIRGKSLRQIIGDRSIPTSERVRWLGDVARALCAAHAVGLVHRDVKPENVMVRDDGTVKVLDFGIAKRSYPRVDVASTTEAQILSTLASEGLRVGTPYYMAPEQMRGEALDGRVDQFSWAVVAYELLSGRPVWGVDIDALQLVSAVLSKEPAPLHSVAQDVAATVGAVVARAMSKQPSDRFGSMEELLAAFEGRSFDGPPRSISPRAVTGGLPPSSVSPASSTLGALPGAPPPASTLVIEPSSRIARPSRRRTLIGLIGAAGVAVAIGLTVRARSEAPHVNPHNDAAQATRCASSLACMTSFGGAPARCREDGICVALASEDCEVHAAPAALGSDDTVWLGTLFPPKDDPEVDGDMEVRAVDLAREDFDQMMAGFAEHKGAHARRFGLVACRNGVNAARAAHHLVDEVHVPAIIGFRSSAELIDLGGSLLIPNGILSVVSLTTSPLVTTLPSPDGQPRLVWRSTYSSTEMAKAMGKIVPDLFEAEVRKQHAVATNKPIRVALVRLKSRGAAALTGAIFKALRFNGKSALDNGGDYRDFVFDESDPAKIDKEARDLVAALDLFAPHVVFLSGDEIVGEKIVIPLEETWSHAGYKPRWLTALVTGAVLKWIGNSEERRHRFFGLEPVSTTSANARFVMHFNESSPTKVTRTDAPNSSYDAFYLLAYATYALGDQPVTGPNLARAIARLVPPGKKIEVGPTGIYDAYTTLRRGENIDLDGAYGSLDFDLTTGEVPFDEALLCIGLDDLGRAAENIESGVVYRSATNKLEGTLRCP